MSKQAALDRIQLATGPAVWYASDFAQPGQYAYVLSESDVHEIEAALKGLIHSQPSPCGVVKSDFPLGAFEATLETLATRIGTGIGFCVIRGIPVERYSIEEAGALLCGIGCYFGGLMPQNGKGELLNHVRDTGSGGSARGYQGGQALPFHSDSCDIVGLLCLRAAKTGGASSIASCYAVHNLLARKAPDVLRVLYEPFHVDRHGENTQAEAPFYSIPVFMWHNAKLFTRFNPGYVYSAQRYPSVPRLTKEQEEAIDTFSGLCESDQFRLDMTLRPGDLQLLNNNVVVHSRTAFEDDADPAENRHLLRMWLFSLGMDDIPMQMRERYRDMDAWRVNAHIPAVTK